MLVRPATFYSASSAVNRATDWANLAAVRNMHVHHREKKVNRETQRMKKYLAFSEESCSCWVSFLHSSFNLLQTFISASNICCSSVLHWAVVQKSNQVPLSFSQHLGVILYFNTLAGIVTHRGGRRQFWHHWPNISRVISTLVFVLTEDKRYKAFKIFFMPSHSLCYQLQIDKKQL